jgi:hypothetical protein
MFGDVRVGQRPSAVRVVIPLTDDTVKTVADFFFLCADFDDREPAIVFFVKRR